jgi:hypothetical protein
MKRLLLIICLLFSFSVFAQKSDTIKKRDTTIIKIKPIYSSEKEGGTIIGYDTIIIKRDLANTKKRIVLIKK